MVRKSFILLQVVNHNLRSKVVKTAMKKDLRAFIKNKKPNLNHLKIRLNLSLTTFSIKIQNKG